MSIKQSAVQKPRRTGKNQKESKRAKPAQADQPAGLLALQVQFGNAAVQRLLAQQNGQLIFRQPEEEPADMHAVAYDKDELANSVTLPGHAAPVGMVARQHTGSPARANQGAAKPLEVSLTLAVNPPTEVTHPAREIAQAHARPGAAGWTTPEFAVMPRQVDRHRLDLQVTLDFLIELAEEYKGATLQVLRDHEFGHINIGREEAQTHLIDGLRKSLLSLPDFANLSQVQKKLDHAGAQFTSAEDKSSLNYDQLDYPRMQQAYLGAQLKLTELSAASPAIWQMTTALQQLRINGWFANDQEILTLTQDVLTAYDGLSEDELARLQYNPEFHALLDHCRILLSTVVTRRQSPATPTFDDLGDTVAKKVQELLLTLESFVWKPPV